MQKAPPVGRGLHAAERSRTSTLLRVLGPEPSASAIPPLPQIASAHYPTRPGPCQTGACPVKDRAEPPRGGAAPAPKNPGGDLLFHR
jgi:hypothetical protein